MDGRDLSNGIGGVFAAFSGMATALLVAVVVAALSLGALAIIGLVWLWNHVTIAWN